MPAPQVFKKKESPMSSLIEMIILIATVSFLFLAFALVVIGNWVNLGKYKKGAHRDEFFPNLLVYEVMLSAAAITVICVLIGVPLVLGIREPGAYWLIIALAPVFATLVLMRSIHRVLGGVELLVRKLGIGPARIGGVPNAPQTENVGTPQQLPKIRAERH